MTLTGKILISFTQLFAFSVMGALFFIMAPWSSAIPVTEAELLYDRKFPADWHGVIVNHGEYADSPLGVIADHQILFFALIGAKAVCLLYIVFTLFIFDPKLKEKIRIASVFRS